MATSSRTTLPQRLSTASQPPRPADVANRCAGVLDGRELAYHQGRVRRAALVLLVLVLVPSTAMASWYRCAYDGVARSACCCPTTKDRTTHRAPEPEASLRAACCCTITQVGAAAPERTRSSISIDLATPPLAPAVVAAAGAPRPRAIASFARSRVHDPTDTLLARHCSLLL
jgi:hypothetical protein